MDIKLEKVKVNGFDLAYSRRGVGNPLILIHGYPLDHTIWNEVGALLEKNFDLILPDMRGFGGSDIPSANSSIDEYARDFAALMDHFNIGRACLAGHSMGGYAALAFARLFPQRVAGLGMISTQTLADAPDRKESRNASAKQVMEKGVGTVVESMTPKLSADGHIRDLVRELISKQRPAGIANALRAMAGRPDSTGLFKTFKFPVVIVHGDADELITVERGREMKNGLPSATYFELQGAGHLPMMEKAEAVANALSGLANS